MKVFNVFKHHGPPFVHQQSRRGRTGLDDRTSGGQIAAQHCNTCFVFEGGRKGLDHTRVVVLRAGDVFSHGVAAGGEQVFVQQVFDFFHHHRQPAGIAKIFHQVIA